MATRRYSVVPPPSSRTPLDRSCDAPSNQHRDRPGGDAARDLALCRAASAASSTPTAACVALHGAARAGVRTKGALDVVKDGSQPFDPGRPAATPWRARRGPRRRRDLRRAAAAADIHPATACRWLRQSPVVAAAMRLAAEAADERRRGRGRRAPGCAGTRFARGAGPPPLCERSGGQPGCGCAAGRSVPGGAGGEDIRKTAPAADPATGRTAVAP